MKKLLLILSLFVSTSCSVSCQNFFWSHNTARHYGLLYNWHATIGIAPAGWHVPSKEDYQALRSFIDPDATFSDNDAGGYLKEVGFVHWKDPNLGATNTYLFTAVGSNSRNESGVFTGINEEAHFWNSGEVDATQAFQSSLSYNDIVFTTSGDGGWTYSNKIAGYSIRLIKDDSTDPGTVDIDGYTYPTVKIGDQVWLKENLRVTHYADGTIIPYVPDDTGWAGLTTGAWCYPNGDPKNL